MIAKPNAFTMKFSVSGNFTPSLPQSQLKGVNIIKSMIVKHLVESTRKKLELFPNLTSIQFHVLVYDCETIMYFCVMIFVAWRGRCSLVMLLIMLAVKCFEKKNQKRL